MLIHNVMLNYQVTIDQFSISSSSFQYDHVGLTSVKHLYEASPDPFPPESPNPSETCQMLSFWDIKLLHTIWKITWISAGQRHLHKCHLQKKEIIRRQQI